jgi:SWI/SNF-related matrix-associated actin-dependent regulator 1 of chromatin subfamily A
MHGKDDVTHHINIISYDLAIKLSEKIKEKSFNTIIIDECHYLKNVKTKRYYSISEFVKKSKRSILITGTPALSRPIELVIY